MLIAQAMYRAIFARTAIRASVLVPYGAVTVVAAFAWRLAFDPATGFAVDVFNLEPPPLTTHWGSMFVIIMAEVWKTTPFIALLLARRPGAGPGRPLQGGEDGRGVARGSGSSRSRCR